MDRKTFLTRNLIVGGALTLGPNAMLAASNQEEKDLFKEELITEFVFAAHRSLDETRKILEEHPLLLNCANQFTKGDFETAVGGASHMGRKDIVDYLVGQGARLDIFNYAFLGYADFVKKMVADYPSLLNSSGPHGFNLLHHALVGEHKKLAEWLQSKGLTERRFENVF